MDLKLQNKNHVIPAEAGIQQFKQLDSRFRGNDAYVGEL
jgi:hypothetical protein